MRLLLTVLLFCLVASSAFGEKLFTRYAAPQGWKLGARASPNSQVHFKIALKQQNLDQLEAKFWSVSDPDHAEYQNFMSISEIMDLIAPPQRDVDVVKSWLKSAGILDDSIQDFGDALGVTTNVQIAESLFDTDFFEYHNLEDKSVLVRSFGDYSVPNRIHNLIDMVSGLSSFPIPHLTVQRKKLRSFGSLDDQGVIPQTLYNIYQVPTLTPGSATNTSQGVIEFQGECFAPTDLASFGQQVNVNVPAVPSANIIGPNDPTNTGTEATLDIEAIAALNPEATNWFWLEQPQYWLYDFGIHFFNTKVVPQIISVSYAWSESDQCTIDPTECQNLGVTSQGYVQRVNIEFQKIGLRGISILVASGDSGANGRTDESCSDPILHPSFPSCSPFVTSVGATQLNNPVFNVNNPPPACNQGYQCPSGGVEVAVSYAEANFASGGGFSQYSPRPTYQKAAVEAYLTNKNIALPPASMFNGTGRGYPDVAAMGNDVLIYQGGITPVGGTSASTPFFAGMMGLLNQVSYEKTGKPLGFLNPFLYKMAAAAPNTFHDITVGDNKCTEQGCSMFCQGFVCAKGWDPVTGLGSLNANAAIAYTKSLFSKK